VRYVRWVPGNAPIANIVFPDVPGVRSITAPPALRDGPVLRPVEVLPRGAVARLEFVQPRGKPLGVSRLRACSARTVFLKRRLVWKYGTLLRISWRPDISNTCSAPYFTLDNLSLRHTVLYYFQPRRNSW